MALEEVKGHNTIRDQLFHLASRKTLPHALLFSGISGIGKKKMAFLLSQTILCEKSFPACGTCRSCLHVAKRQSESVLFIEPQSSSIKVDEIRGILPFLSLQSDRQSKIVIIDQAHTLTLQACNALLKTLEEPPLKSLFILISGSSPSLPATLLSRLQAIRFSPLSFRVIKSLVPDAEPWMYQSSRGSLSFLKQLQDRGDLREVAFSFFEGIFNHSFHPFLNDIPQELKKRDQALFVAQCFLEILRDSRFLSINQKFLVIHEDKKELLKRVAKLPKNHIDWIIKKALQLQKDLSASGDCVLCFEQFAISLATLTATG